MEFLHNGEEYQASFTNEPRTIASDDKFKVVQR